MIMPEEHNENLGNRTSDFKCVIVEITTRQAISILYAVSFLIETHPCFISSG